MIKIDSNYLMYLCKRGGAEYRQDIYKAIGISQVPFQRRMAGEIPFTVEEVQKLASIFHISLEELQKVFFFVEQ